MRKVRQARRAGSRQWFRLGLAVLIALGLFGFGVAAARSQENPLGLAIGATALGFLAGLLLPSTRMEDEKIGPMADQVKDQIKETGQEALERGKDVAQQAAETAKEAGQQHADELKGSAQERAETVSPR